MSVRSTQPWQTDRAPLRRCVVCRESAPKHTLVRVVRTPDSKVVVCGRTQGRGAYVHADASCLAVASSKPKMLVHALRLRDSDTDLSALGQLNDFAHAQPIPTTLDH